MGLAFDNGDDAGCHSAIIFTIVSKLKDNPILVELVVDTAFT